MAKAYETKAAEFKERYEVDIDISAHYSFHKSFSDEFFNRDPEKAAREVYIETLVDAMKSRLDQISKIGEGRRYLAINASIGEFIEEFDQLMQIKFAEDTAEQRIPNTHKPLEGATYGEIARAVVNRLKSYDKPISDVWATSMIKGTMTLDDIKAVVDPARARLNEALSREWGPAEKSDYVNTMLAKRALDTARAGRSIWWKLWAGNWRTMYRERKYSEELEANLLNYTLLNRGLDEGELRRLTDGSMLSDAKDKLKDFVKAKAAANEYAPKAVETFYDNGLDERENLLGELNDEAIEAFLDNEAAEEDRYFERLAQKKEDGRKRSEAAIKGAISSTKNLAEVRTVLMKPDTANFMKKRFTDLMKNCSSDDDGKAKTAKGLYDKLSLKLMDAWRDNGEIGTTSIDMFKEAYFVLKNNMPTMTAVSRLAMAQRVTDLMINFLSPAVKKPELEGYGNGYAVSKLGDEDIQKLTGYEGDVTELISSVKNELGMSSVNDKAVAENNDPTKERVNIPQISVNDESKEVGAKVEEISAPTKEKSIK